MSISTLSLSNVSRASILRIQSELRDATKEATTGRMADVGLGLGRLTGNAVSYRAQESSFKSQLESNKLVSTRIQVADNTLTALNKSAESFSGQLINGTATASGVPALVASAKANLAQLTGGSGLGVQSAGQYLFAGTQSDVQPIQDGSAALKADFEAYLGAIGKTTATVGKTEIDDYFAPGGKTVTSGTPSVTRTFSFDAHFTDAAWDAGWSNASGDATARISASETVKTSASANDPAFRKLAASYAIIGSLGVETMGEGARQAVVARAQAQLSAGRIAVDDIRADFGVRQNRITAANTALTQQHDIVKAAYDRLEGVDETEAALLMNSLKTQLETSFAVTGRIQGLSILNYL